MSYLLYLLFVGQRWRYGQGHLGMNPRRGQVPRLEKAKPDKSGSSQPIQRDLWRLASLGLTFILGGAPLQLTCAAIDGAAND